MAKEKRKKTKPHSGQGDPCEIWYNDYAIWYHKFTTTGTPPPPSDPPPGCPWPEYSAWRQHYIDTGGNPTTPPPPPPPR